MLSLLIMMVLCDMMGVTLVDLTSRFFLGKFFEIGGGRNRINPANSIHFYDVIGRNQKISRAFLIRSKSSSIISGDRTFFCFTPSFSFFFVVVLVVIILYNY
jgi:hypothetical protein